MEHQQQQRPPFSPHNVYRTPSYNHGHRNGTSGHPILQRTVWNDAKMLLSPPPPPLPRKQRKREESSLEVVDDDENVRPSSWKSSSVSDTAGSPPSLRKELFIPLLEEENDTPPATPTSEDGGDHPFVLSFADGGQYDVGNGNMNSAYSANVSLGVRLPKRRRQHYRHHHRHGATRDVVTPGKVEALFLRRIP